MKKLLLVLVAMFVSAGVAMAAGTSLGKVTCNCNATPSVMVSTASSYNANDPTPTIDFGLVSTGFTCTAAQPFFVWNTSPQTASAVQKYSLSATVGTASGTNWTLNASWAADVDICALAGNFKSQQPANWSFTGTQCLITNSIVQWTWTDNTTGNYNYLAAGDYSKNTHGNPVAGTASQRQLWIGLKVPSAVSNTAQKTFTITVQADLAG